MLRDAVEEGLANGYTKRHAGWQGWRMLAEHFAPGAAGSREGAFLLHLLRDERARPRGEVFDLLTTAPVEDETEPQIAEHVLLPRASELLTPRLRAVAAYEQMCAVLEEAFDWIRYLSTHAHTRPISAAEFANEPRGNELAAMLPSVVDRAEANLAIAPLLVQQQFSELAKSFTAVRDASALFEAILDHHRGVQKAKKPDGKRDWFERAPDGATFVRMPYRLADRPELDRGWNRPYRIATVASFLGDLRVSYAGA